MAWIDRIATEMASTSKQAEKEFSTWVLTENKLFEHLLAKAEPKCIKYGKTKTRVKFLSCVHFSNQ